MSDGGGVTEPVERRVAEIWTTVLGVDRVGADDDFFALGGDSLAAVQIGLRTSAAFGRDVPPDAVFTAPSVAAFAALVRSARMPATPSRKRSRRRADEISPLEASAWATGIYRPEAVPHVGDVFRLDGPLEVEPLQRALTELIRRHETLRTIYPLVDHHPTVRVLPPAPMRLAVTDLSGLSARDRDAAISAARRETLDQPFAYMTTPPFRARLLRLAGRSHVLILGAHEIVCDGEGFAALLRDLSALYNDCAGGTTAPSRPPIPRYRDVFDFEGGSSAGRAYWRDALAQAPMTIPLPWESGGLPRRAPGFVDTSLRLPEHVNGPFEQLARSAAATTFMVHLAAYAALLHLRTGERELAIEVPTAGRRREETQEVVAFFARVLVLRLELDGATTFRELLLRTRDAALTAFRHAEAFPGYEPAFPLTGVRGLARNLPRIRLLDDGARPVPDFAGIRCQTTRSLRGTGGHLELRVVTPRSRPASIILSSSSDGIDKSVLHELAAHYLRLVQAAGDVPDTRLDRLLALDRGHGRRTPTAGAEMRLEALVTRRARGSPGAIALHGPHGRLSYGELERRSDAVARDLRSRGLAPGARVGLALAPSAELLVAMLGVLKARGVCVPLAAAEPTRADLALLLTAGGTVAPPARGGALAAAARAPAAEDAFVVRTAGVVGSPHDVVLPHALLARQASWLAHHHRLEPADRGFHAAGPGARCWALAVWPYLASGGSLVVPRATDEQAGAVPSEATVAALPPQAASRALERADGTALRLVRVQGHGSLAARRATRGRVRMVREYVATEAGGTAIVEAAEVPTQQWEGVRAVSAAAVSPALRLLDSEGGDVPPETVGELCFGDGTPLRTGDLGRLRLSGTVEFLGRRHDEIRYRGHRMAPLMGRLEARLREHPVIEAAGCSWDAQTDSLVAHLVARPDAAVAPAQLDDWVRASADEQVLPARYRVVEGLPARPDGSVDRIALHAIPGSACVPAPDPFEAQIARRLARIWKTTLGRRRIRPEDNFFALGGDLVLGVEMIERARAAGIAIPPDDLLTTPTIAALVARARPPAS